MAGEKSLGVPQATISLLAGAVGTFGSIMQSRASYMASKDAARRKTSALLRQKNEEQRLAAERAELRLSNHIASTGAASALAGQGSAITNVAVLQQSMAYGTAMEATSDMNATNERLHQITRDVQQVKRDVEAARRQHAINTWTGILGGAMSFGQNVGALQGAVKAKRETAKQFTMDTLEKEGNTYGVFE